MKKLQLSKRWLSLDKIFRKELYTTIFSYLFKSDRDPNDPSFVDYRSLCPLISQLITSIALIEDNDCFKMSKLDCHESSCWLVLVSDVKIVIFDILPTFKNSSYCNLVFKTCLETLKIYFEEKSNGSSLSRNDMSNLSELILRGININNDFTLQHSALRLISSSFGFIKELIEIDQLIGNQILDFISLSSSDALLDISADDSIFERGLLSLEVAVVFVRELYSSLLKNDSYYLKLLEVQCLL